MVALGHARQQLPAALEDPGGVDRFSGFHLFVKSLREGRMDLARSQVARSDAKPIVRFLKDPTKKLPKRRILASPTGWHRRHPQGSARIPLGLRHATRGCWDVEPFLTPALWNDVKTTKAKKHMRLLLHGQILKHDQVDPQSIGPLRRLCASFLLSR